MADSIDLSSISTGNLQLSQPTYNALGRKNITNLAQLLNNLDDIINDRSIRLRGEESILEIVNRLWIWLVGNNDSDPITFTPGIGEEEFSPKIYVGETSKKTTNFDNEMIELSANIQEILRLLALIHQLGINDPEFGITFENAHEQGYIPIGSLGGWRFRPKEEEELPPPVILPLKDSIKLFINSFNPREREIVTAFYGIYTGKQLTLQETAELFGITRERIRQILVRFFANTHHKKQLEFFVEFIKKEIQKLYGVLSTFRLLSKLNLELNGSGVHPESLIRLFKDYLKKYPIVDFIYKIQVDCWCSSEYYSELIDNIAVKVPDILDNQPNPLQWSDIYAKLISDGGMFTLDEEFALTVMNCLLDSGIIEQLPNGSWTLPGVTSSRKNQMAAALRKIGKPAHFNEIAEMNNLLFPNKPASGHLIHAAMLRYDIFVRVGRGTYGLQEWGLHNDGNLANAVRRVLHASSKPLHQNEIISEVLKTWQVSENSVVMAMYQDARFENIGEATWRLTPMGAKIKKTKKFGDDDRIDRYIIVLRNLARPASSIEITEKHNTLFPEQTITKGNVNQSMNLYKDIFICLEQNVYGLVEWGIDQKKFLADKMYTKLHNSNTPFFAFDQTKGYKKRNGVPMRILLGTVLLDDRFVLIDDYIVLSEWGEQQAIELINKVKSQLEFDF